MFVAGTKIGGFPVGGLAPNYLLVYASVRLLTTRTRSTRLAKLPISLVCFRHGRSTFHFPFLLEFIVIKPDFSNSFINHPSPLQRGNHKFTTSETSGFYAPTSLVSTQIPHSSQTTNPRPHLITVTACCFAIGLPGRLIHEGDGRTVNM